MKANGKQRARTNLVEEWQQLVLRWQTHSQREIIVVARWETLQATGVAEWYKAVAAGGRSPVRPPPCATKIVGEDNMLGTSAPL